MTSRNTDGIATPHAAGSTTPGVPLVSSQLGAFARIYDRDGPDQLAAAFVEDGLVQVQLNLSALGLPTIPDPAQLAEVDTAALATAFTSRQLTLWGVSATYNMAHPDQATRRATTDRAARFIARLGPLGPVAATLCTGTRDPASMWRPHADNDTVGAWADFRASLETLLPAAADAKVLLAVEPEPGNVVSGTAQAQRLAKELGSDAEQIGFILDPANLVSHLPSDQHEHVLTEAFDVLGDRTICLHAKDIQSWADTLGGRIGVDYRLVSRLYRELPRPVPFIIQDATEDELPLVRDWLLRHLAAAG